MDTNAAPASWGTPTRPISFIDAADSGFPLFPIHEDGRPWREGWQQRATTDLAWVQEWATRWPAMAIATGRKCDVFDIEAQYLHLVGHLIDAHEGPMARSARGGVHLYTLPTGLGCPRLVLGGIHIGELKGRGGSCTVPPSIRKGGEYQWTHAPWERGLRPASAGLLALVPPKPAKRRRTPTEEFAAEEAITRLERLCCWVADLPEGERNSGLYWATCRALDDHVPADVVRSALLRVSSLPHHEATATIGSAVLHHD